MIDATSGAFPFATAVVNFWTKLLVGTTVRLSFTFECVWLKDFTIVEMKAESSLLAQNDSVVTPDAFVLRPRS